MPGGSIEVIGLKSLLADLRAANRALPRVVTKSLRETTKTIVEPAAKSAAAAAPKAPSEAPAAFKAFATTKGAGIRIGYSKYPWAAGTEYGSYAYSQFRAWVGNRATGAVPFPGYVAGKAVRDNLALLERRWLDDVIDALATVGKMQRS